MNTLIGTKLAMTQRYVDTGSLKTVTIVSIEPQVVVAKKFQDKNGYDAVAMGVGFRKSPTKALKGSYSSVDKVPAVVKEVRGVFDLELGQSVGVADVFKAGDKVKVVGITKGKGFTGVVKRHGFAGGPKTHGQSDRHRAPGSIGAGTTPGRVLKGLRMAGRSGGSRATVRNLTVLSVDEEKGLLYLSGPVPGHYFSTLTVTKIGEQRPFSPMVVIEEDKGRVVSNKMQDVDVVQEDK